jgi:hypothetical protein
MTPAIGFYFSLKMKIVREYIEFKNMDFERTGDPYKDLKLGKVQAIDQWLAAIGLEPDEYRINPDLTVDVFDDVNIVDLDITKLPDFIQFNEIFGGFYAAGNAWESLTGFPKKIIGDLQLRSPSSPRHFSDSKRWKENYIRKKIKIHGKIYN